LFGKFLNITWERKKIKMWSDSRDIRVAKAALLGKRVKRAGSSPSLDPVPWKDDAFPRYKRKKHQG